MNSINQYKNNLTRIIFLALITVMLQACGGGGGETAPAVDITPDASLNFNAQTGIQLSQAVVSNTIIISGINASAPVSIIGGEYSVNQGVFTSANGTIDNGQSIRVRQISSNATSSTTDVTLTIGGVSGVFSVTTIEALPSIIITPLGGNLGGVSEGTATAFTVKLKTQPNSDVTLSVLSSANNQASVDKASLTFSSLAAGGVNSWNTPQTVTVTAINDQVVDADVLVNINVVVASSNDPNYPVGLNIALLINVLNIHSNIPGQYIFNPVSNVLLNQIVISNPVTINGINIPTAISVTVGDSYSINGGGFVTTDGTVSSGDVVRVRLTASSLFSIPKSATLTIGGVSSTFTATTLAKDTTPTSFAFLSPGNRVTVSTVITSAEITVAGINSPSQISVSNAVGNTYFVNGIEKPTPATVNNGDRVKVQLISSNLINTAKSITLTIGGVSATFVVNTVAALAEVIVTPTSLSIKEATTATFNVVLNSEPLSDIVITLSSNLASRATVNKTGAAITNKTLLFSAATATTTGNWQVPQSVTVAAIDDGIAKGDTTVPISVNVTTGDSRDYNSALNKIVNVTVLDIQVPDSKEFLQFLNKTAPRNNEFTGKRLDDAIAAGGFVNGVQIPAQQLKDAGAAYYAAVDPNNLRLTLSAFKAFNNNLNDTERAVYINDADLGFGRRMYVQVSKDINGRTLSVASCVENYSVFLDTVTLKLDPNVTNIAKLNSANAGTRTRDGGYIAAVCMEYSGSPGTTATTVDGLTGRKFVKFFSYGAVAQGDTTGILDERITEADLDGDGLKTQPGVCNTCHGGQGNSLLADGTYPLLGDTGAQFLPWDLSTLIFDNGTENGTKVVPPGLEPIFNRFNQAVLDTYPKPLTFKGTSADLPLTISASSTVSSSINVTGITEPVTSVIASIDSVANPNDPLNPLPGLTTEVGSKLGDMRLSLVSPDTTIIRLGFRLPGNSTELSTIKSASDLFFTDDSFLGREPIFPVNGTISGTVQATTDGTLHYAGGLVRRGDCIATPLIADDFGCRAGTSANGIWSLSIKNFTSVPAGQLKAWSIHINGIPEKSYLPAPLELIRGWYGGLAANGELDPAATFNSNYVPVGWKLKSQGGIVEPVAGAPDPAILYSQVVAPTCRACHIQRGTAQDNDIDFSTYAKFMKFKNEIKSLVFDKGLMPLAKRTYQNHFWKPGSQLPSILAEHILGSASGAIVTRKPGRNIANAGVSRIGNYSLFITETVNLNGRSSLFNNNKYSWTVLDPNQLPVTVTAANTATPSFNFTIAGVYTVILDTSDTGNSPVGSQTRSIIKIEASTDATIALPPVSYDVDLQFFDGSGADDNLRTCGDSSCHGFQNLTPNFTDRIERRSKFLFGAVTQPGTVFDFTAIQKREAYRIIRDRVNTFSPDNSKMFLKGLGIRSHAGTSQKGLSSRSPRNEWNESFSRYIRFRRWVLEGANYK